MVFSMGELSDNIWMMKRVEDVRWHIIFLLPFT